MPNKSAPRKIWRHVGGEGGYSYLDDMNAKELADLEVLNRNYERIAAADAASHQKCFDYYEQKQREEQAKKFDLRLRIGVFFDGTGNFHRRFYMDGIGTVRGDEDSWIGLGTGRGEKRIFTGPLPGNACAGKRRKCHSKKFQKKRNIRYPRACAAL